MPLNREDKAQVFASNLYLYLFCFHFRFEENKYFKRIGKITFLPNNVRENIFEKFGLGRKRFKTFKFFFPSYFRIYAYLFIRF